MKKANACVIPIPQARERDLLLFVLNKILQMLLPHAGSA
jgi:hypothetical protein